MEYVIGHDLFDMPVKMKNVVMLSRINEFKGQQVVYKKKSKDILNQLNKEAILDFTFDSCVNLSISREEFEKIFLNEIKPTTRDEINIVEFKDVLKTVNNAYSDIDIDSKVIRELHGYLYRFSSVKGGQYKVEGDYLLYDDFIMKGNNIREEDIQEMDYQKKLEYLMENLCSEYNVLVKNKKIDKLVLVAAFIIDFILISPFEEGNIKMAKVLTMLLLNKNGYEVSRYSSLGEIYDKESQDYFRALFTQCYETEKIYENINKWLEYFLGFILNSYGDVVKKLDLDEIKKETKTKRIEKIINSTLGYFTKEDIKLQCPDIPEATINRVFNNLRKNGKIEVIAKGRSAKWKKI